MSHNIQEHDIVTSVKDCWHRLERKPEGGTITFENSGLDWESQLADLYYGPEKKKVVERKAVVRPDKNLLLGVVSPRYSILGNRALWEGQQSALSGVGHRVEVAGSLDNCRKVWISVSLDDHTEYEVNGDTFHSHLTFYNSHDGSEAFRVYDTCTRVVCQNTLTFSLNGVKTFNWCGRHSKDAGKQLDEMSWLLKSLLVSREKRYTALAGLTERAMTKDELEYLTAGFLLRHESPALIDQVKAGKFQLGAVRRNRVADITSRFTENGNVGIGNRGKTRYDGLNAFTEFASHGQVGTTRGTGNIVGSSMFGRHAQLKVNFMDVLSDTTEVGVERYDKMVSLGQTILKSN